jgi:hypothetical protein
LSIERSELPRVSPNALLSLAALIFLVSAAQAQTVPYISDVVGEELVKKSDAGMVYVGGNELSLIGTFKLFNPDTVPFYIWITFENGGKFKHQKLEDAPTIRLVDLELHYRNERQQPMVKKFPNTRSSVREKNRFGGSWLGGGRGKKGRNGRSVEEEPDVEAGAGTGADRGGRGNGASEIGFWKEDAQVYYEMELWGVLYTPDVRGAVVAGRYVENIKFEIEPMR